VLGLPTQTFFKWKRWPVCRRDLEDAYVTNAAVDPYRGDPEFGYRLLSTTSRHGAASLPLGFRPHFLPPW